MFSNYLKISLRNIRKYKGYTFINVTGLAVSLACCMLISLWILNEMSYDKHYADLDRITAILVNDQTHGPNALAAFLQENIPEIQYAARVTHGNEVLINNGSLYSFEDIFAADPEIIRIFSFPFIAGDPNNALTVPNSIIISQQAASRFFPDQDAIGKTLSFDNQDNFTVTGVIENIPPNSTLKFDFMVPIEYERQRMSKFGFPYDAWNFWSTETFAKIQPGVTTASLTEKISGIAQEHYEDREVSLSAINISDVYLKFSETRNSIKIFSAIAFSILILACINFINLSTARYRMRARETGIRKIIGASRKSLMVQFLGESVLLMIIGFLFALGLVEIFLPLFNSLFQLNLSLGLFYNFQVILAVIVFIGITALGAGIYPALILSRFHPVHVMKDKLGSGKKSFNLRRVLVVFQFSITAILILGTVIVYTQINYIKSRDVGYNKEHVVNIRLKGESGDKYQSLKNELLQNPKILSVTGGAGSLPYWYFSSSVNWDGLDPDEEADVYINFVDYDYTKTFGIELTEGRDFDKGHETDPQSGCIINESLARLMDQSTMLGSRINVWDEDRQVIGVMKDFNFHPLDSKIEPLAIIMVPGEESPFIKITSLSARIRPNNIRSTLRYIEETWKRVVPNYPFEYSFLDAEFDENYKSLEQTGNLAGCFGLLAIFIAGLGLFGLASFTTEQRTKEIGIRKVLGASIINIVRMISREYIILVGISNLVAWPLAWYAMHRWLEEFAYHIDMSISTFIMVGCFTLTVAILSVGYKAIRAACTNPVDAIKYE